MNSKRRNSFFQIKSNPQQKTLNVIHLLMNLRKWKKIKREIREVKERRQPMLVV